MLCLSPQLSGCSLSCTSCFVSALSYVRLFQKGIFGVSKSGRNVATDQFDLSYLARISFHVLILLLSRLLVISNYLIYYDLPFVHLI